MSNEKLVEISLRMKEMSEGQVYPLTAYLNRWNRVPTSIQLIDEISPPKHPNARCVIMKKRGKLKMPQNATIPFQKLPTMGQLLYVLAADGRTPIPASDPMEWVRLTEDIMGRRVATDRFSFRKETEMTVEFSISTVFTGAPITLPGLTPEVFETLVSWRKLTESGEVVEEGSEVEYRWKAWDMAAEGHDVVVESIFSVFRKNGVYSQVLDSYRSAGLEARTFRDRSAALPLPFDSLRKLLASRNNKS